MVTESVFKKALKQIFQDGDGLFSSKRVSAFIAIFVMVAAFCADIFLHVVVTQFIFDGFMMLALGSLGITGVETFAKRPKSIQQNTTVVTGESTDVNVSATPQSEE